MNNIDLMANYNGVLLYFHNYNIIIPLIYKSASTFISNIAGYTQAPHTLSFITTEQDLFGDVSCLSPTYRIDTTDKFEIQWDSIRENTEIKNFFKILADTSKILLCVRNPYDRIFNGLSASVPYLTWAHNHQQDWKDSEKFDTKAYLKSKDELIKVCLNTLDERLDVILESKEEYPYNKSFEKIMDDGSALFDDHIKPYYKYFENIEDVFRSDNFTSFDIKDLDKGFKKVDKDFYTYVNFLNELGAGDGSQTSHKIVNKYFVKKNYPSIIDKINQVYDKDFELFGYEKM